MIDRERIAAVRTLADELALPAAGLSADEIRKDREYIAGSAWRYAVTLDRLAAEFGRPLAGAAIVDIGAFPGHLAVWLSRRERAQVTAVTLMTTGSFERHMQDAGVSVARCDIERDVLPGQDGTVDVALCCELIEHLDGDVRHMLSEARRIVGPGGLLLLTTPNHASLPHRWSLARGRSVYPALDHPDYPFYAGAGVRNPMRHIREFTVEELTALLRDAGFSRVSAETVSPPVPEGGALSWRGRLSNQVLHHLQKFIANSGALIVMAARP